MKLNPRGLNRGFTVHALCHVKYGYGFLPVTSEPNLRYVYKYSSGITMRQGHDLYGNEH